jgi:hypothetical protein
MTAALVLACYGFALRLPFFFDDLPIITWLRRHSWLDIWTLSSERAYFRPLTFTIYRFGLLFPLGASQAVLHGINLLLFWASALLVKEIVQLTGRDRWEALLASVLFTAFPLMSAAVPWITAMPHQLVSMLTALAALAALKAEQQGAPRWWGVSLLGMALAPLAHESGAACAVIVGGVLLVQRGLQRLRGWWPVLLGGGLNVGFVVVRGLVPGVRAAGLAGLQDWPENVMFFLHGLVYPVAPAMGWLVERLGGHDFTLVTLATLGLLGAVVSSIRGGHDWRHSASSLWWWACAALPAAASLRYGYLFISPRVYALSAIGTVMVWTGLIAVLVRAVGNRRGRGLVSIALVAVIVGPNLAYVRRHRILYKTIDAVYQRVLFAAQDGGHLTPGAPLGFVNLPRSVAYRERMYPLVTQSVTYVPQYSNVAEFIEVNSGWRPADAVMFSPVLEQPAVTIGFQGKGLTWEEMRQFAVDHGTTWLTRWRDDGFMVDCVGTITTKPGTSLDGPRVTFEGGPVIDGVSLGQDDDGLWTLGLEWIASGPVDGRIFVHVFDANGELVMQADGPALGGMVPPWIWQPGDRIHDVRTISTPGDPPHTVLVGLFNESGRFPAYVDGARSPDDAATVAVIGP